MAHREAAARLRSQRERIVALWAERVRELRPSGRDVSSPALMDTLPALLDALAVALTSTTPRESLEVSARQLSPLGTDDLEQVVLECAVLRDVVLGVLEEEAPHAQGVRDCVFEWTIAAIGRAAGQFSRHFDQRVRERYAELRLSEERFRHMVEAVKDYAIFTLDPEGVITSWNAGCMRVKGYAADEAIGRHYSMLYPEEGIRRDEPMGHLRTAVIEGRFRGQGMRVRKNGEHFLADVSITPIFADEKLIGFTKVVQDLTERNLLMQERDLSRMDAQRLKVEGEYREWFVAGLTHDLRSPLAAAKTSAELIARSPEKVDRVRTWAHRISESVERTDRMISDLLDASRLEAGEPLPLEFQEFDLQEVASELTDELSSRHGARFLVVPEGNTRGVWSRDGLWRVLDNLLSNAVKYGEIGQPITLGLRRVDDRMLIVVHNTGSLISSEEQALLFQPFHRTQLAQRSGKRGWGIGLTLVKGIVEAHGGIVKVESYPHDGTTFTVDVPVDARESPRAPNPAKKG